MRSLPLRPALVIAFTCALTAALFAQRYNSMSTQELQRRLERDTNQLVDSLRNQRNTPSTPTRSGPDPWVQQIRAREAQREREQEESARLDAEWRRDHPNETRQQYFARIDREAKDAAREALYERQAATRAREAREAAERERAETTDWARIRASNGGYAAQVRPPVFSTSAESLAWFLLHESRNNNEWAGNQAAMLLIEGVGVPQDLAHAFRLLDPNGPTAKKIGTRHPETRALFAYLQLTFPDAAKAAGHEPNVAAARQDLEDAASKIPLAQWYLARVLNQSKRLADQKRALRLITPGAAWARIYFASQVRPGPAGRDPIAKHLSSLAIAIFEKQRIHLPTLMDELPMAEFEALDDLLPYTSEPLRTQALTLYAESVVERIVPLTPAQDINYYAFDNILEKAGEAGIEAVYGLAVLRRHHLLEIEDRSQVKPSWGHFRDPDRALAALSRWAKRDDVLGSRARLAIAGLAEEAASPSWYVSKLNEVIDYQNAVREHARLLTSSAPAGSPKSIFELRDDAETAKITARRLAFEAFARRDAAAPKVGDLPAILTGMEAAAQWRDALNQLTATAAGNAADSYLFAVTPTSFDLKQATARYDEAFAPGAPDTLRWHHLFEATRLGDAFAPGLLARELSWRLPAPTISKLQRLTQDRLARDEAARRPRALLARAVMAHFGNREDAPIALAEAAASGSALAARLLLNERIGATIARENDRPISWGLDPALIAEYDAAIAAGKNEGPAHAEWNVVRALFSINETELLSRNWFNYLQSWIADRDERRADAEFARAILPQVDALLATLAEWPGLNQDDPLRSEWTDAATRARERAQELVRQDDGIGAMKAFLTAAGRGDRGALELLSRHIRNGDGGLPRSPEIADRLQAASLKMTMADAEVGDAFAADYIGECYRNGTGGVAADPAQAFAWLRYAAELGHAGSARTLAQTDAEGLNRTPTEIIRWTAIRDALEYEEFVPKPPRRLTGPRTDIAPVRAKLEACLAALAQFRTTKPPEPTDAESDAEMARIDAAKQALKKDPLSGLVLLAAIAATDNRYMAHEISRILARGDYGLQPDPALAQRFHAAGLSLLERDAEYGETGAADRLGRYALGLGEKPDVTTGLRWLTYSAELGNSMSAEFLAQLYTDGAPGLPPDPKQAARWTAFVEKTNDDNFKPRDPLR